MRLGNVAAVVGLLDRLPLFCVEEKDQSDVVLVPVVGLGRPRSVLLNLLGVPVIGHQIGEETIEDFGVGCVHGLLLYLRLPKAGGHIGALPSAGGGRVASIGR